MRELWEDNKDLSVVKELKDKIKDPLFLWTIFCFLFVFCLVFLDSRVGRFSGTDITIDDISSFDILSVSGQSPIIMEGASSEFFVMRGPNDQIIYGSSETKPLGWPDDEYYQSDMMVIRHGKWHLETGNDVSLQLISELDMKVTSRMNTGGRIGGIILSNVMGLSLWYIGYCFLKIRKK